MKKQNIETFGVVTKVHIKDIKLKSLIVHTNNFKGLKNIRVLNIFQKLFKNT